MSDIEIADRAAKIAELGLTVESKFIPFSQSRNKAEKHKTLNWSVTVKRNGRDVLTCDYSAGIAYCPAYNRKVPVAWDRPDRMWIPLATDFECESGFALDRVVTWRRDFVADRKKPILPDALDVLYSLSMDSDVLNYAGFESWAETFDYAADRACLDIALKLRAALGDAGMECLNTIFQDY